VAAVPLPIAQVAFSALNHVLRQQQWARDRLRAHAGRTIRLVVESPLGELSTDASIAPDGTLVVAAPSEPAVTMSMKPSIDALFGALRGGARGLGPHLRVDGDVLAAGALGEVAQHLRWDLEEDLSRVVGDVLAHRLAQALRAAGRGAGELRDRVESGLRHYLVDEDRQLVSRADLAAFAQSVGELEAAVERLERSAPAGQSTDR